MSITFPAAYSAELTKKSVNETWLVQLFYDAEGASDFIGLSDDNVIVSSVQYYGIVISFGSISKSIDLVNSTGAIDSISITCQNVWKTGKLSDHLMYNGDGEYFLNHKIRIYSRLNDEATLSNCAFLYEGVLRQISNVNEKTLTLEIEGKDVFAHITLPSTQSTNQKIYQPVIYGAYTPDETGPNIGMDYPTSAVVHPVPVVDVKADRIYAAHHEAVTADGALYVYEKNCREFIVAELDASPYKDNASESYDGVNCTTSQADLNHGWHQRPLSIHYDNEWNVVPANAIDTDTGTYAQHPATSFSKSGASAYGETTTYDLRLDIPIISVGKVKTFKVHILYYIDIDGSAEPEITSHRWTCKLLDNTFGNNVEVVKLQDSLIDIQDPPYSSGSPYTFSDNDNNGGSHAIVDHSAALATANYVLPEYVELIHHLQIEGVGQDAPASSDVTGYTWIYDVFLEIVADLDQDGDAKGASEKVTSMIHLYSASDGFDADFTDGSAATAVQINEVHRDIMDRFGGVDFDNDQTAGWTDLNTARDGWDVRLWLLEPTSIRDVLEQLQFEGGFIFIYANDFDGAGNPGGKYIYVKDDPSGDLLHTFTKDDYKNLRISTSSFSDVIIKRTYNSQPHPAENKYQVTTTYPAAPTDNYKLGSAHFEEINLDYLFGSKNSTTDIYDGGVSDDTADESIVLYYDNIINEPKIMINFDLINKTYFNTEIGDIIQLNDSEVNPFGKAWSNVYFMVVQERHSVNVKRITAREVYRT